MASLADRLKQVPLFEGLGDRQLRRLARHFRERSFRPGTTILREREMSGVGFFIVTDGEASVNVRGTEVIRLGPGDYFGELGLISRRARLATVKAETPLQCLEITAWHFREFARENPAVLWKLLEHVVGLLADEQARLSTR